MSSVIEQMDRGLKRYYEHQGAPYFNDKGVGKFQEWIQDNGYDSDGIKEEFEQSPHDIAFIEFDENFPINSAATGNNDDRIQTIFKILFACFKDPSAFFQTPNLPDEDTQMEMAVKQSLLQTAKHTTPSQGSNHSKSVQSKPSKSSTKPHQHSTHRDDLQYRQNPIHNKPDVSYFEQSRKPRTHGTHPDDADMDFYGYSDEEQDEYITNIDANAHPHRKAQRVNHSKAYVATDARYESQLTSPHLEVSSVKDNVLRQQYKEAIELRNMGHNALRDKRYTMALKYYSRMFMYVGCNGIRTLRDFCTEDGDMNPLQKYPKHSVYTAMDKLRISAYTQMAYIYTQHTQWNKVIDKCTQVLESEDTNLKALLYRGRAYRQQKQFEKADIDLMKAKHCDIVDMAIESELNALKRNKDGRYSEEESEDDGGISSLGGGNASGVSFTSFTNHNWPSLPLRDIAFEAWLRGTTRDIPYEMLYPVPLQKNRYKLYQNEEMLDLSVMWLDVEVAERLIDLNAFDVNKQKKVYSFQSYMHQLCAGTLCGSGYTYEQNTEKFIRLLTVLCTHQDTALEVRDDEQRTALAHAVRNNRIDSGIVLLRYGANVNDGSVKKEIQQKSRTAQEWLRKALRVVRSNSLEAIHAVVSMQYGIEDRAICMDILDFTISAWKEDSSVVEID